MGTERLRKAAGLVFLGSVLTGALLYPSVRSVAMAARDTYESLEQFANIIAIVQKNYVDEVDTNELIEGAIQGMVSSLDSHSAYLTPDLFRELQIDTRGEFGGLGIEITVRDGVLTIVTPIEGTPAFRAGIKPGDQIIKIGDKFTKDMTLQSAVDLMRGKPGTRITLWLRRLDADKLVEVDIAREVIHVRSVRDPELIDEKFAYVRLTQFQEGSAEELENILSKLTKELGREPRGIILDLRYNPGGLLTQAVKVSDLFLDAGLIVSTNGRISSQQHKFLAHADGTAPLVPMVVLVNEGSASASEIVAGALQDQKRGLLVGTKTFGKGSVQTILPLSDEAALRLTTARYYTPSGRSIHELGIEPDVLVEPAPLPKLEEGEELPLPDPDSGVDLTRDVQLARAVELLNSWQGDIAVIGGVAGFQLAGPTPVEEAAAALAAARVSAAGTAGGESDAAASPAADGAP